MIFNRTTWFTCFLLLVLMSSCVSEGYDLDNINTTVQIGVKDLTVPVNIDRIVLDRVLKVDDESQVKKVLDPETGEYVYAVVESGSFESSPVEIPTFSSSKPETADLESYIYKRKVSDELDDMLESALDSIAEELGVTVSSSKVQRQKPAIQKEIWDKLPDDKFVARYPIGIHLATFDTPRIKVHEAISKIDYVETACQLTLEIDFKNLDYIDNVFFHNVRLQLPKGLKAVPSIGVYDSVTGVLDLSNDGKGVLVADGKYKFSVSIEGMDFNSPDSGAKFITNARGESEFYYSTMVKIMSGELDIYKYNFVGDKTYYDLPKNAGFVCHPDMSPIEVLSFSGKIKYSVEGIDAKSISLTDVPDVICGEGTNIFLKNPQIYLSVNNPLADNGIYAEAGVALTPLKNGEERDTRTLDDGALRVEKPINTFCLSPSKPSSYCEGWEDAQWQSFSGLSSVISGNGVPDKINVNILNPGVPEQQVTDFRLGQDFAPIHGDYLFYAPLALDEYSVIVYEDTVTGWNENGDMDKLEISALSLSAVASSDLPLGAKLTITALDESGEGMPGVEFSTVELQPNQKNQTVNFELKSGTIRQLDGISIRASIVSDGNSAILPAQQILLENVRVKVSGKYIMEEEK